MPHGFFTIEQWKPAANGKPAQWTPILNLDAYQTLNKSIEALEKRRQAGLYRIVQTQRCVWAQMEGRKLHLHRSHASSAASLVRLAKLYESEGGRRPVEKARQDRVRAKAGRNKK